MMKKTTCETFVAVLTTIKERGITTRTALMADRRLYEEFWYAACDFSAYCLLSKTGKLTKTGTQLLGNAAKVDGLAAIGVTTREDITLECAVKLVDCVERIIRRPTVDYMRNYAYSAINSTVDDYCRRYSDEVNAVPLDGTVDRVSNTTFADLIGDTAYDPVVRLVAAENVMASSEMRRKQQTERLAKERDELLREIDQLADKPAELLIHLISRLKGKSQAIADFIIENGAKGACEKTALLAANRFMLPKTALRYLESGQLTNRDLRLSDDPEKNAGPEVHKKVLNRVYHLRSRAKKTIEAADDNDWND